MVLRRGRLPRSKKACIECLATNLCKCRASDFQESFCITDALLRAAILGDPVDGLFYTGQSVTQIPERSVSDLETAQEIVTGLELAVDEWERIERSSPRYAPRCGHGASQRPDR